MNKSARAAALLCCILLFATACAPAFGPEYAVTYPNPTGTAWQVREENPLSDTFTAALADFGYKTSAAVLGREDGNANFSPLSLYLALASATAGAKGETRDQLLALLGAPSAEELAASCGNLFRRLYLDDSVSKLKIANSVWMAQGFGYEDAFLRTAAESFYASSYTVDFADPGAGRAMGRWISDNTGGTLEPALEPDPETVMALINTVYFYDQWVNEFNKSATAPDIFHAPGGDVTADFMNAVFSGGFAVDDGFTRASLPLKNAGSMVFILPDEGVQLDSLLASDGSLRQLFEGGDEHSGKVTWKVPKMNFNSDFDLATTLKALGITEAFDMYSADFSGITGDVPVYITDVMQQTYISVNEQGVEASAFTAIMIGATAAPVEERAEMILDRPFVYGIMANDGTLLFAGVCRNPK